ncbi:MAG: NUDIX hydrolase [Cyanobacteria bacterium M5B4]|nr:MAG: NUDIX hydrolase [Cyanobacteria bacterium M5B4]
MTQVSFLIKQNRLTYQGRKYKIRIDRLQLPNGKEGEYEYIIHPGAAMVVPVTADGRLMMIKQYRFAVQHYLLEFPAGTLEPGEEPETTIKREIEEETGYRANFWQKIGSFFLCPGYSDEIIHVYLAKDLQLLADKPPGDEDEDITVELYNRSELEDLIHASAPTLVDSKSITAFHMVLKYLD